MQWDTPAGKRHTSQLSEDSETFSIHRKKEADLNPVLTKCLSRPCLPLSRVFQIPRARLALN